MRRAPKPHAVCGSARAGSSLRGRLLLLRAFAVLALVALSLTVATTGSRAQLANFPSAQNKTSSFPNAPGGMFGAAPKIDQAQPLYMQADQLLYDTKNSRVIAQGNV